MRSGKDTKQGMIDDSTGSDKDQKAGDNSGCCSGKKKSAPSLVFTPAAPDAGGEQPLSPLSPATPGCCQPKEPAPAKSSCCHSDNRRIDWLLWISAVVIAAAYLTHWLAHDAVAAIAPLAAFVHGVFELMNKMWWGILLGVTAVGVLSKIPRELVVSVLGKGNTFGGLLRATAAGVLLDLCSHGILLVGMQLYRRGASLGQTMAFLIASPWNSLSLTIILVALIGWGWTLAFVGLSVVIALASGLLFDWLVRRQILPGNPNAVELPENFAFFDEVRKRFRATRFDGAFFGDVTKRAFSESGMILRWIFFGTVLAALLRAFLTPETFAGWFGPTAAGLALTLLAATVIEVCSEGSSPIAADLLSRGGAPGNAFTFLMAGVATDYTEILSLRETTRSWKISFFLPLVTVPQVVLIGWILNHFSG